MKHAVYLAALFACFAVIPLHAQPSPEELPDLFNNQLRAWPQEKIYVHTDKSCYIAGEDVWFRAYLVDGLMHMADTTSRYVYAEIIDPQDSLVTRVKIRPGAGVFQGHFSLDAEMPGGDYLLRYYTRFMQARGEEYFFKKTIRVGGPFSSQFRVEPSFAFDAKRDRQEAAFSFVDLNTGTRVIPNAVRISETGRGNQKNIKGDDQGVFSVALAKDTHTVYIEYDCDGKRNMEFITVTPPDDSFDVAFLPEGGNMIYGQASRVGFKAISSNGLGRNVSVTVINSAGDTLGISEALHKGMGRFTITPEPGLTYHAVCAVPGGASRRFELPEPLSTGVALHTDWRTGNLQIRLVADPSFNEPLYLLLQCRGFLIYAVPLNDPQEIFRIEGSVLPGGVIQVIVADKEMRPLSERLVFNVNPQEQVSVSFDTEKPGYGRREHIKGGWNIREADGVTPLSGSFSVSVTDDRYVDTDHDNNIYSTLLLTSELKGYIESPAYYFEDSDYYKRLHLDILMMTQGWSRYDVAAILQGVIQPPRGHLELGPVLSGVVRGGLLMNRGNPDYPVSIMTMGGESQMADMTTTDSEGNFFFNLPEMPEGTRFLVQGKSVKGGDRVELLVDPEGLPGGRFSVPHSDRPGTRSQDTYMRRAEEKYVSENGARLIVMDEIAVRASAAPQVRFPSYPQSAISMQTLSGEDLERHRSMRMALMMLGVNYVGGAYSIRGSGEPLFQVDGMDMDSGTIDILTMEDVAEIAVIKDATSGIYGLKGGNGAVLISTKRGFDQTLRSKNVFNMKVAAPLGYQPLKEFYSPRYETPEQRRSSASDLRTTLYWNPNIKSGENGRAELDFYSGDSVGSYTVILEGITDTGCPVYYKRKIAGL